MSTRSSHNKFKRKDENNPENFKWGLFYFNPDDSRIIVPKRAKWMGWTFNFGNLWSYVILLIFVGTVILLGILLK